MDSSTTGRHFTPGKDPVPILQEAGWGPGHGLDGRKIVPSRIGYRTVLNVVSRNTDWATGPTFIDIYIR